MSAPNDLRERPAQSQDSKQTGSYRIETNAALCVGARRKKFDNGVPISDLLVLDGFLEGKNVRILKDDGCNTNVMSYEFFNRYKKILRWKNCEVEVRHSKSGSCENSSIVILGATLKIGTHKYRSNWLVADCRYDLLLGMPWHVSNNPLINYQKRFIKLRNGNIRVPFKDSSRSTKIMNMSVKKFRRILNQRRYEPEIEIFKVVPNDKSSEQMDTSKNTLLNCAHQGLKLLLNKFEGVFKSELPAGLPPKREVDHEIETEKDARPPHRSLYQLSPVELKATKEYVEDLLKKGKIRPSKSPYGAPLFFVKEKDKPLRGVVDYRGLNRITKRNNSPLPRSDEMFDLLGEAKFFSKMDLKTGFHQIRVKPEDIEKTAFNTKYGQFEYLVMPMGLCNAPATFQSLMNRIFYDCVDMFMVVYMDDLLIFSKDEESHLKHLEIVLSRLKENNLYVSPKKCEFMKTEIKFLGLIVGRNGLEVNPAKVEVLKSWPKPKTLTEVRSFMGLLQFFRRFIKDFSKVSAPLTNLTKKGMGIRKWNKKCDESFQALKDKITSAPILIPPSWNKPFRGHIDASETAVGGTLTQLDNEGMDRVIAFFSRKLSPAEENYSANDRELLGLVYFLERFRCYLEGSSFEIFTDNQVLKHFFSKPNLSRREARWVETLGNFGIFPINLKPGKVHVLGDTLSRAPHIRVNDIEISTPSLEFITEAYKDDEFYGPLISVIKKKVLQDPVKRKKFEKLATNFHLDGNKLIYEGKICVPRKSVKSILHMAHDCKIAGHFGYYKTLSRLKSFYWKHKARDVRNYVQGCLTCQQKKDSREKKLGDPTSLEVPNRRWGSVATDFIVSLPKTRSGYNCITTWVDRLSRRVHFIPSNEGDTAVDSANAFFSNIFKLHGLPDSIVSDRDPKFTSKFWKRLMELCGVKLKMSTSRHPQTDGASEIMNRMVENYIRCYCNYHQNNWDELLPAAEFAYNSAISEDIGMSPFEMDLGYLPKSFIDSLHGTSEKNDKIADFKLHLKDSLRDAMYAHKIAKASQTARASLKYKSHSYKAGDKLWINKSLFKDAYSKSQVSDKLTSKRFGPFIVKRLIGKNAVEVDLPSHLKIHNVINVTHTMPYYDQPKDISSETRSRPDPVPADEGEEYVVQAILSHRKKGSGFQFLTLMQGDPSHDAEWQPTQDFIDSDGTMNDKFYEYIKRNRILENLWSDPSNDVVGSTTEEGGE